MYENTILNALKQYYTHLQIVKGLNVYMSNSSLAAHIQDCVDFIEKGNEVTHSWMKNNHDVVSKSVKYSHNFIHQNYTKSDSEYLSEEHKELNRCVHFFREFYEKSGVDSRYMEIDF